MDVNYSTLEEILPLKGNAITVTFMDQPPEDGLDKRVRICQAMQAARKGNIFTISEENHPCKGGSYWCGFIDQPRPGQADFLVNKEHIVSSLAVAHRAFVSGPLLPKSVSKYMVIASLDQTNFEPDLVMFYTLPQQACRLLSLSVYDTGIPRQCYVSGSTCRTAISNPLMTGDIQLSFIDMASRKRFGFKPEELIVSMPYNWFLKVLRNHEIKRKFPPYIPSEGEPF